MQQRGNDRTLAMSFDPTVKDEDILAGFSSLHGAMAEGFDRMSRMFERQFETNGRRFEAIDRRFEAIELLFQDAERQILDLRNDVARPQTRMLRRFDEVDAGFDKRELRVTRLDERIA
jgi:hypothetical protein